MALNKSFNAVVAMSKNLGIGLNGTLPWRLPKDMRHFKDITSNYGLQHKDLHAKNVVIMGRKTWESLPDKAKPLGDRINIVLSSNPKVINDFKDRSPNLYVCNSLDNSLEMIDKELGNKAGNIFLIGGKRVYEEGFSHPNCNELFLTRLGIDMECDTFLSKDFLKDFKHVETSRTYVENKIPFDFQRYVHKERYRGGKETLHFKEPHEEFQYLKLIDKVINEGAEKEDRTGVGVQSLFGETMRFNLEDTFPLLTTKNVFFRGVVEELLWFVRGQTDANILKDKGITIWDGNSSREFLDKLGFKDRKEGDIGPGYGFQWRHFGANYTHAHADYTGQGVDQLQEIIDTLKKDPTNRRMIMTAWNPAALRQMALPPCHMMSQFYVANGKLSCLMYQRSCDIGLGVPFNIASYSLLACMIAQVCGLQRGEFVHVLGDAHIYKNHVEPLKKQAKRIPNPFPLLEINPDVKNIEDFKFEDFTLHGYNPQSKIKMSMAV